MTETNADQLVTAEQVVEYPDDRRPDDHRPDDHRPDDRQDGPDVEPDEAGDPLESGAPPESSELAESSELGESSETVESSESVEAAEPVDSVGAAEPIVFNDAGESEEAGESERHPDVRPALEAIMMVADEPISEVTLASVLDRPQPLIAQALRALAQSYAEENRGFDLREVGGGWRYYTRADYADVVERFVLDGQQARLTQAALETLAVIAYRQPVSRARVSAIRGVNCDGVTRTLLSRGLVEEAGTDDESQATLYRTTSYFLERLGLQSLDELPDLAPYLPEVEQVEAERGAETLARDSAGPDVAARGDTVGTAGADDVDGAAASSDAVEPADDAVGPGDDESGRDDNAAGATTP